MCLSKALPAIEWFKVNIDKFFGSARKILTVEMQIPNALRNYFGVDSWSCQQINNSPNCTVEFEKSYHSSQFDKVLEHFITRIVDRCSGIKRLELELDVHKGFTKYDETPNEINVIKNALVNVKVEELTWKVFMFDSHYEAIILNFVQCLGVQRLILSDPSVWIKRNDYFRIFLTDALRLVPAVVLTTVDYDNDCEIKSKKAIKALWKEKARNTIDNELLKTTVNITFDYGEIRVRITIEGKKKSRF